MPPSPHNPEGPLVRCPTCDERVGVRPSPPTGEASCPRCRARLWFVVVEGRARLYPYSRVSAPKRQLIEALACSGADSLDLVELVMELEKQLGINEDSLKKMGGIRSLGELIDFIIRASPD